MASENKRLKKLALNRKAAQKCRQRKRERMESLEFAVATIYNENAQLRDSNKRLRGDLSMSGSDQHKAIVQWVEAHGTAKERAAFNGRVGGGGEGVGTRATTMTTMLAMTMKMTRG